MKRLLLIILFSLFYQQVLATTVTIDRFVVDDSATQFSGWGNVLGIPRQHIVATENGGIVAFESGSNANTRHLFYSADLDVGWNDTLIGNMGLNILNFSDHGHVAIDYYNSDTDFVYITNTNSGGDKIYVTKIAVDETNKTLTALLVDSTYSHTADTTYSYYRAAVQPLIGTDSLFLVTRGHDGTRHDSLDIMYFISGDRGDSWSDSTRLEDLFTPNPTAFENTRIGMVNRLKVGGSPTVSTIVCAFGDHTAIEWWNWDLVNGGWDKETNDPIDAPVQRMYSMAVVEDTIQFVVTPNSGTNADSVRWAYKSVNASVWTSGIQAIDALNFATGAEYNLCANFTGRLVMFYTKWFYASADSCNLNCMWFDFTDNTFKDETIVSDTTFGRAHGHFCSTYYVPSSHGDVAYMYYTQYTTAMVASNQALVRVNFLGTVPKATLHKGTFKGIKL